MPNEAIAHPPKTEKRSLAQEQRQARLAAELRSNLHKRKEQARSRALHDMGATQGRDEQERQPDAREAATRPTGEAA